MRKRFSFCFLLFIFLFSFGFYRCKNLNAVYLSMLDDKYDQFFTFDMEEISEMKATIEKSTVWLLTKAAFNYRDTPVEVPNILSTAFVVYLSGDGVPEGKYILALKHTTCTEHLTAQTPFGPVVISEEKISEKTYLLFEAEEIEEIELSVIFKNFEEDVALFELPESVDIPAIPYPFGNSDDLALGVAVFLFGRPMNLGELIPREGKVNNLDFFWKEKFNKYNVWEDKSWFNSRFQRKSCFVSNLQILPGDSGGLVFASRDGKKEIVGIIRALSGDAGGGLSLAEKINPVLKVIKQHFNNSK